MNNDQDLNINKKFDLEERTLKFSKEVIRLVKSLPKNSVNFTLSNQILRSGTSVGANYREANDALGNKDFAMRIKICRKEAKETFYWLELILENNPELSKETKSLLDETNQLIKIFSAIAKKS